MALMRYEPFNMLNQLQREMNRLFESSRRGDEEGIHRVGGTEVLVGDLVDLAGDLLES